jgi:hypothetical protein
VADLTFDCVGARADQYAVTPGLTLRLRITDTSGDRLDAIALRCQIRIEPHLRRYTATEAQRLHDLFGDTDRWADTLKPLQLANLSTMVPGFTGSTTVDLPMPCTYDLEIASTKYFNGLDDGVVPLLLLFSGTVFSTRNGQRLVWQVPWSNESAFEMPVRVWREAVDAHFPNSAWLRVRRDTLDALQLFKSRNALTSWDSTLAALLSLDHAEAAELDSDSP